LMTDWNNWSIKLVSQQRYILIEVKGRFPTVK
jgi:hypothetical protein